MRQEMRTGERRKLANTYKNPWMRPVQIKVHDDSADLIRKVTLKLTYIVLVLQNIILILSLYLRNKDLYLAVLVKVEL
jgi:hypothetical protein